MKLHQKLLVVLSLLVFFPIIIVFITATFIFSQAFENFVQDKTRETISLTMNYIEDHRQKVHSTGKLISSSMEFKNALKDKKENSMMAFLERIREYIILADMEVYDCEGELFFTSVDYNPEIEGYREETVELINQGLKLRKFDTIVEEDNGLIVKSVHPIVTNDLKCLGVLIISYPFNNDFLDLMKIMTNSDLILYTKKGKIVATTLMDNEGNYLENETENLIIKNIDKKHKTTVITNFNIKDTPYSIGIDYIMKDSMNVSGLIAVAIPKTWFQKAKRSIFSYLLTFTVSALLIAIILSFTISRSITNPLRQLSLWAQGIESGDTLKKITINSSDEVGELARVFNKMVEKIYTTLANLEETNDELDSKLHETRVLFDVSQTINYIPDTNELLIKILDKTIDATGADHASIMLLDEEVNNLHLKLVRGIDYDRKRKVTLEKGMGIAGIVVDTGEPIIVNEGEDDPRFIVFTEERKVKSMLCVPLLQSGKPFGVLNVVIRNENNTKEKFLRKDLRLSISIANQIALVIDKAKLYQASITDGMTKLYIHNYFKARLKEEVRRAKRYDKQLTLIMCDLDHFKSFNDTWGHQMGDKVLCTFSEIIKNTVRDHLDIPARYGGEEFAIICPETSIEGAVTVADRIRTTIAETRFEQDGEEIKVTASFGIAKIDDEILEMDQLIKSADIALYQSKDEGRNKVSIFNP